jgi:CTP synthase
MYMPEVSKTHLGGTMRLGLRPTVFQDGTETWSKSRKLYGGKCVIWERHRHRYEVNPEYIQQLLAAGGMEFVGRDEKGERMQVMELRGTFQSVFYDFSIIIYPQITHTLLGSRPIPSFAPGL